MRVNIGYGCDLDDVQEEIASFLERVSSKLSDAAAQTGAAAALAEGKEYSPQEVILSVHRVRVLLSKLDLRLDDVTTIVAGLEEAKVKIIEEEELALRAEEASGSAPLQVAAPEERPSRVKGPAPKKKSRRGRKKKESADA